MEQSNLSKGNRLPRVFDNRFSFTSFFVTDRTVDNWYQRNNTAGQSAALRQIRSNQLVSWSLVDEQFAAFTKLNPWQRRHVNMPVLISSCIFTWRFLKPWSYYLVEEQWTFSTVFDKIMRGELSSSESEAYQVTLAASLGFRI